MATAVRWYRRRWEERRGGVHDGWGPSTWLFETDADGGVIRQIEDYDTGPLKRYWDGFDEDDDGGRTSVDLDPADWSRYEITRDEFDAVWNRS